MKHFGHKGLALGAVLCMLVWAGNAQAAGYEVRLPVEKTVRLGPLSEPPAAEAAKPEKPEKKAEPAPAAAKDLPKPEARKPEASKPEANTAEASKVKAASGAAAKTAPKPVAKPEPAPAAKPAAKPETAAKPEPVAKPEPAPAPAPKPKPLPKVDPLALQTPPAPEAQAPIVLPEGGHFVGDMAVEFQSDQILLRVATNGPVERVTTFGVKAPRKLAVDLHGAWRKKGPVVLRFNTGPVKNVVVGEHPDRLRLAMEFREGAVEPDLQPKVESDAKGVVVTIPLALHLRP